MEEGSRPGQLSAAAEDSKKYIERLISLEYSYEQREVIKFMYFPESVKNWSQI